ncbi:MAG: alpha-amylase family glycosyl hydrolase, partial [Bacteroidota bacterium]
MKPSTALVTAALTAILLFLPRAAAAQDSLDVLFRYLPDLEGTEPNVVRAYLPGNFNNWGPNSNGRIAIDAPSRMTLDENDDEYRYTIRLRVGETYTYKVHYHRNSSGSEYAWLSDPLNDRVTGSNNDSVLELTDPMIFQPARRHDTSGSITEVSATILASAQIDSVGFEVNGVLQDGLPYLNAETGIFRYTLPEAIPPGSQFALGIRTTSGERASVSVGVIPPTVVDAPRPEGIEDGINQAGPSTGTVTFSLFAPGKSYVYLIGDFNDWQVSDDFLMYRDAVRSDSVHWWITVDGLEPGREYGFQYFIDGQLRLADPFAEKVLDPVFDRYISTSTYPGLKPYPTSQTSEIVGVFRAQQDEARVVEPRPGTPQHELVIYELLIRDFLEDATYETLRDTLQYFKRLGVNAIELMPVSQFNGNLSWGYDPTFHAAIEKAYGPRHTLEAFIEQAHAEGIAVIVDVVYNHAHDRSSLVRLYGPSSGNPFLGPGHAYNVFFHLNHDHPYIQYYVDRANRFWLEEMRVDGFRFDLSKGFATNVTDRSLLDGYNAERIANLKRMADAIWDMDVATEGIDPEGWQPYIILEHFAADTEERELAQYRMDEGRPGMMLWNNVNHSYNEATMGYHSNGQSNFSRAYFGSGGRGWTVPHLVSYMESHDEQWLMFKNLTYGNSGPNGYDITHLPTALDRMKLAGTFFFTIPGPKMMWQFGELGYGGGPDECLKPGDGTDGDCSPADPGRTAQKPVRWEYYEDPLRQKLFKTWSELLRLRREHAVFRDPETDVSLSVSGPVKRITLRHEEMDVVIVGNFDVSDREIVSSFPSDGTWYDFFNGTTVDVEGATLTEVLLAGDFRLYTSEFIEPAEAGLITVSSESDALLPVSFTLEQNYPNPFNPSTLISYSLDRAAHTTLEVFDLLGRRTSVLVDGPMPAGRHRIRFDAD